MTAITKRDVCVKLGKSLGVSIRDANRDIGAIATIVRNEIVKGEFEIPGFVKLIPYHNEKKKLYHLEGQWDVRAEFSEPDDAITVPSIFMVKATLHGVSDEFVNAYFNILSEILYQGDSFAIARVGTFRIIKLGVDANKKYFKPYQKLLISVKEKQEQK
jgi:nucleoid DNA-binding protein